MTISSTTRTAGPFTGTGGLVNYPFIFAVFQASDILAVQRDTSGNLTTWALTVNYSVTLNPNQSSSPGGYITPVLPLPAGYTLTLTSQVQELQGTSITNNGGFYPQVIETAFDYLTVLIQQLQLAMNGALVIPFGGTQFNAEGTGIINLANGVNPQDAVTLSQAQGIAAGAAAGALASANAYTVDAVAAGVASAVSISENYTNNAIAGIVGGYGFFQQPAAGSVSRTFQSKMQERISILDFAGSDPTGTTYNDAAMANALASVAINGNANYIAGPRIYFPPGTYLFQNPVNLKCNCILEGDNTGVNAAPTAQLVWPDGILAGIIVNRYNTLNNTQLTTTTTGADGSIIRNLWLQGGWSGTVQSPGTTHGIWLRARAVVSNCTFSGWSGNGIHILANSAGSGANIGNANGWSVDRCNIQGCGQNGLYLSGTDVNAGMSWLVNISNCNMSGILDSSFLGNSHIANQVATCSLQAQVSDGTNRYYCIQGTGAGTTTPASNPTCWTLVGAGGVNNPSYPLWVSGNVYVTGYAYQSTNLNAQTTFLGCYSESNNSPSSFVAPAMAVGGQIGNVVAGNNGGLIVGTTIGMKMTGFQQSPYVGFANNYLYYQNQTVNAVHGYVAAGDLTTGVQWCWDNTNGDWMYQHAGSGTRVPFRITTNLNSITCGLLTAPLGGQIIFGQGLYLGSSTTNARFLSNATAIPTTAGYYAKGQRYFNINPTVGGNSDWICTTAGYVGTAPAWVASTAYNTLGAFVSNGGNAYVLTTAGTSASSGGPTGTGTNIVDGTCVWNFVPVGILSPAGNVALEGSGSYAGGTITSGSSVTLATITTTGAVAGDFALGSLSVNANGLTLSAYTTTNTTTVTAANLTGSSITLGACTVNARVFKQ